jgi:biopolymer transport protein ExbD
VANLPDNQPEDRITVTLTAEGRVMIGDRPVNLVLLVDELRGILSGRAGRIVYLRADEGLRYGKVIEVVDKLKQAGVEQIGFAYVLPQEKR